ncbi:MAG: YtxH domain-containing protein [Arcobacteraceae bacterium]|jgi:hypothetical protein|nr:YtxH domain-containing protein [Arcobacteraceae bacterium]
MQNTQKNPYIKSQTTVDTTNTIQNPYINNTTATQTSSIFDNFDTKNFLIGATIGAIGAYLLTNEKAQKALFKTIAGSSEMFQAGVEELKEKYEDAKAELEASKQ